MNTARKGRDREHRSRRWLEEQGYSVMRAAASKGVFDLVAISATDVQLIQVKSGRWPGAAEMRALWSFRCPPNVRRVIHRWRDRQTMPDVKELK